MIDGEAAILGLEDRGRRSGGEFELKYV